jgi:hypothetical protein
MKKVMLWIITPAALSGYILLAQDSAGTCQGILHVNKEFLIHKVEKPSDN